LKLCYQTRDATNIEKAFNFFVHAANRVRRNGDRQAYLVPASRRNN